MIQPQAWQKAPPDLTIRFLEMKFIEGQACALLYGFIVTPFWCLDPWVIWAVLAAIMCNRCAGQLTWPGHTTWPCTAALWSWLRVPGRFWEVVLIETWSHCPDLDGIRAFSQATRCGKGICHAGRSWRQRPGTMVWLEVSNVGQLCPMVSHFSKPRPESSSISDWKDWKGLWSYDGLCISDDNVWQSRPLLIVCVSGRREAWKWTAKQTRQRWAKLVTHSDTILRKSHDLKQKGDLLSCRRDVGLTEFIKFEDIGGESALPS